MARMVSRAQQREGVGTGMKVSETAIFIVLALLIVFGARWYFFIYRKSPGYALGQYISAMETGNVVAQYDLIDAKDKQSLFPTKKDYEKEKQVRGYTERISNISLAEPVLNAKNPDIVTVDATFSLKGVFASKNLMDTAAVSSVTDKYTLERDKEGAWKVALDRSPMTNLLKNEANAPSTSFE